MPPRSPPFPGPKPVTKNVMSGAWGNCGCWASPADATTSARVPTMSTLDLFIEHEPFLCELSITATWLGTGRIRQITVANYGTLPKENRAGDAERTGASRECIPSGTASCRLRMQQSRRRGARLKVGRASMVRLTFSHRRELAVAVGSRSPRRAHYRAGCRRTRYLSEAMSQRSRIDDGVASEAAVSD